jgi:PAS domain S-box-containing protein
MRAAETNQPRHSIVRKVILVLAIAMMMLAAIATITYRSTRTFIDTAERVARSREIIGREASLVRHLTEAESGARGYIISGEELYLRPYEEARTRIVQDFNALKNRSGGKRSQSDRLENLRTLMAAKMAILKDNIAARRDSGAQAAIAFFENSEDEELMRKIRDVMGKFENEEQQSVAEHTRDTRWLGEATTTAIVATAVLTAIVLVASGVIINHDFIARRRAEQALAAERSLLRSIIDTLPHHVFVKDLAGRYVLDNAAHRSYLRVKSLKEVEGKTVRDFFPKELAAEYEATDRRVLEGGESVLHAEERGQSEDGSPVWLSTTKVPLRNAAGKTIGLVCVSADITERKAAEEKLRLFAEQLERSNQELQDFASVASHDLQEPLRKILAFGDRLRTKCADALGETGRDYMERILDAARRMQTLIHDLLTLSRVTSRGQPFVEVDLAEMIWDVISDLDTRIEQTHAQISVGSMPVIEADPPQMRQLLQNLLSNALKFHRPGEPPQVAVRARVFDEYDHHLSGLVPGDRVCEIAVQDNGIGFDEKYAERIFAVFQRLHNRSEYPGTGIGLAVCRKIADRHAGTIAAKSAEGKGATFIVTLPVKQRMKDTHEENRFTHHDSHGGR